MTLTSAPVWKEVLLIYQEIKVHGPYSHRLTKADYMAHMWYFERITGDVFVDAVNERARLWIHNRDYL